MAILDSPTYPRLTSTTGAERLVTVKDGREVGLPVNGILGLGSSEVTLAAPDATVVSRRLTVFSGRSTATVATIPAASGSIRRLIIQNANTSTGAVTITAPTASIYTAASATPSATNVIAIATCATFESDGTNWYRITT